MTAPITYTFLMNHTLTSRGQVVNQRIRNRFHVTVTANGVVNMTKNSFEVVCR